MDGRVDPLGELRREWKFASQDLAESRRMNAHDRGDIVDSALVASEITS